MSSQYVLPALALLIQKFGAKIDGGHEIYIPDATLARVMQNTQGQIQEGRHPTKAGVCVRYFSNPVIEGKLSGIEPSSESVQPAEPDDEATT